MKNSQGIRSSKTFFEEEMRGSGRKGKAKPIRKIRIFLARVGGKLFSNRKKQQAIRGKRGTNRDSRVPSMVNRKKKQLGQ